MAETSGDQLSEQTMTDGLKSLDLSHDSSCDDVISETVEDLKDKCESIVNNDSNDINDTIDTIESQECQPTANDYCRKVDSEAEDESIDDLKTDNIPEPQYDVRVIDRLKAMASNKLDSKQIKCTIITTEPEKVVTEKVVSTEDKIRNDLTLHPQRNNSSKPKTEKWGESVGIVDELGRNRRVISLDELNNWMILESWGQSTQSKIYCSLINERYPRFFDSTVDYYQRWRMRYNIFVDKVLSDADDPSIVHIGELHLYFDLIPKFVNPYYVNNSFYLNQTDVEKPVDTDAIIQIKCLLDSMRKSQAIFQLKFPVRGYLFHNTNHIFDKFNERQQEMMEEARTVHRKGIIRYQKRTQSRDFSPLSVRVPNVRSDRDFGQNSRQFHQIGRPNRGRGGGAGGGGHVMSDMRQGFGPKNVTHSQEYQLNDTHNKRTFGGNRGSRSFGASNRKPFQTKVRPKQPFEQQNKRNNNDENEVMFEDTRDRQTNGPKIFGKTRKGMNRNDNRTDDRRVDAMFNERRDEAFIDKRDGVFVEKRDYNPKSDSNHRNNSYSMDSEFRRFKREDFRPKDKFSSALNISPATGPFFQDSMEQSRQSNGYNQSLGSYGQPLTNVRHSSSIH